MTHDERYQVRNADIERALRTLAALIDEELPDGWGWGLFMVPFGAHEAAPKGEGAVFWISNSERAGMIDAVKGWIEDQDVLLTRPATPSALGGPGLCHAFAR